MRTNRFAQPPTSARHLQLLAVAHGTVDPAPREHLSTTEKGARQPPEDLVDDLLCRLHHAR